MREYWRHSRKDFKMKIIFATGNKNKMREIHEILGDLGWEILSMKEAGIDIKFVQDNQSASTKGVLRGLHRQINYPQSKLVRVIKGSVFDVAVDMRENSPTYLKWYGIELTEENKKQFLIPKGFAHGFLVLSDYAEFCYKVDDFFQPNDESGIAYNDPTIGVKWPISSDMVLNLSEKDKAWKPLK